MNSNWSYSPETLNWVKIDIFSPCDLEIWQMTLKNNRAPALTYFKLCASFGSHLWIQTRVMVRKRPNWGKICFDLFDLDLWPLTLYFCMDIMSVNCNNSRKFWDDTMRGTLSTRETVTLRNPSADRSENGPTGSDLDQWNIFTECKANPLRRALTRLIGQYH